MQLTFLPGGEIRAVWSDDFDMRALGAIPQRASRVEVVTEGPRRGDFSVDFSLLAALSGDERLCVCLTQTFRSYAEAIASEIQWLKENWVRGPNDQSQSS